METVELRPLSLGELLDQAFALYRNHFWLFAGIMAVPAALSIPGSFFWLSFQGPSLFGIRMASPMLASGIVSLAVLSFILFWVVYAVAIGAATYAVSETYLGQKPTVRGSYGKIRGKFWRLMGVLASALLRVLGILLLVSIGIAVAMGIVLGTMSVFLRGRTGTLGAAIAGISIVLIYLVGLGLWAYWSLRYAVSIPAMLLESLQVNASIRRSVQLTQGRRWQLFLIIVLCVVIAYVGIIVFQGPFLVAMVFAARNGALPQWLTFSSAVGGAVGGAVTGPIVMIALVLCYYDTRIRKEAFDLQFMMSSMDSSGAA